jgi:ubiquinone/menaquinone biosynthesis C-methylase UbiE
MNLHVCPSSLSSILDNYIRKKIHNPEKILSEYIKPGYTVVDIGCGPGYFSIPMANMVGKEGKVISVDLQEPMLLKLKSKAINKKIEDRIKLINCEVNDIKVEEKADFILTFWMVHEVDDVARLFQQIVKIMKPGAIYLFSEPKIHVPKKKYQDTLNIAKSVGLKPKNEVAIRFSRSIVFTL